MSKIFNGTAALIGCCVFYLIWWILAFRPDGKKGVTWFWLLPAAVFGLMGIAFCVSGISAEKPVPSMLGIWPALIGVVAYFILLFLTSVFMHRQVTSELFLIIGWAVLEICVLDAAQCFAAAGGMARGTAILFMVIVVIGAVVSLIAYLWYYRLNQVAGYIDGMVPLVIIGGIMAAELVNWRLGR